MIGINFWQLVVPKAKLKEKEGSRTLGRRWSHLVYKLDLSMARMIVNSMNTVEAVEAVPFFLVYHPNH